MKNQLFIPSKIKVGYQERQDTYTKRLAYVIYYDNKGVLRKETSWKRWIDKGHDGNVGQWTSNGYTTTFNPKLKRDPLPTHDFDNVPTEGFVLNKKAGGYSSGWNHRATYCRVWDPRGFEFEISIPNLLYILQETSSFKGKGLDGTFVYAWDGKDLVLLPTTSPEYVASNTFTQLQSGKVSVKELVDGYTYETKKQETLIYIGKFDWIEFSWRGKGKYTKRFVFVNAKGDYVGLENISSLARIVSDVPVSNFAELVEKYGETDMGGPIKGFKTGAPNFETKSSYGTDSLVFEEVSDTEFNGYEVKPLWDNNYSYYYHRNIKGYELTPAYSVAFKDGRVKEKKFKGTSKTFNTSTINQANLKTVSVELCSGKEVKLH